MHKLSNQHWLPAELCGRLHLTLPQKSWLLETQSLTARFRQTCPTLTVKVLSEQWQRPLIQEAKALGLPLHQWAWVRCVVLICQSQPLLYARTVIPHCHPKNPWFALKTLGNQPLGEVLFNLKNRQRSPFRLNRFQAELPYLSRLTKDSKVNALARQSIFYQKQQPLLLTEVFLTPL